MLLQQVNDWHRKFKIEKSNLADASSFDASHIANAPDANAEVKRMI